MLLRVRAVVPKGGFAVNPSHDAPPSAAIAGLLISHSNGHLGQKRRVNRVTSLQHGLPLLACLSRTATGT